MKTRLTVLAASALLLALPMTSAEAGFLKNAAKVAKLGVAGQVQAAKLSANLAKNIVKFDAFVGVCAIKAATKKPCF